MRRMILFMLFFSGVVCGAANEEMSFKLEGDLFARRMKTYQTRCLVANSVKNLTKSSPVKVGKSIEIDRQLKDKVTTDEFVEYYCEAPCFGRKDRCTFNSFCEACVLPVGMRRNTFCILILYNNTEFRCWNVREAQRMVFQEWQFTESCEGSFRLRFDREKQNEQIGQVIQEEQLTSKEDEADEKDFCGKQKVKSDCRCCVCM